ncbi:MAG: D-glycero-beta-D-manno-heptose 1-phosphate adenylyltransferase [Deltaproteobacteria bacterium]|nr:D-glycero-beta-D-manno-heptose 1-phosphate adenylyltransferase [Deltaproteobacteria bacterium]
MKKLMTLKGFLRGLKGLRRRGRKIVFTNGCFDIIHAGHVRYLSKAKTLGDLLVVGLNSDSSVMTIKGKGRPIVPEEERAEVLSALQAVDYVIPFDEPTPIRLIEAIKPDVLVKGADWKTKDIVGADIVKKAGGRVARIRLVEGRSTTNIIKKIMDQKQGT